MAEKLLIYPLDLTAFDPPELPTQTEFTDLVNQELGDSASAADGFDQVLQDLSDIIDSLEGGLVLLGGADGGDLDDTFIEALEIDPGPPGDNLAAGQALVAPGDAIVNDLGNLLAAVSTPTPPAGGGGGTPANAARLDFGTVPSNTATSRSFGITNALQHAITITGFTFTAVTGANIFSTTPLAQPYHMPAGGSLSITIFCDATTAKPGSYSANMAINTDLPNPQPTVLLTATVIPGPGPGGGGGGGGGGSGSCHLALEGGGVKCVY